MDHSMEILIKVQSMVMEMGTTIKEALVETSMEIIMTIVWMEIEMVVF